MNQFQKNALFVGIIACFVVVAGIGINYTVQERARRLEEQKVQWRKANIKSLKDLSVIGALSTEEQKRMDVAGDDFDHLQQALLDIHQERLNFWSNRAEDVAKRLNELRNLYTRYASYGDNDTGHFSEAAQELQRQERDAVANWTGYEQANVNIRKWKPVSFEDFRAGKLIDSPVPPKVGEQ